MNFQLCVWASEATSVVLLSLLTALPSHLRIPSSVSLFPLYCFVFSSHSLMPFCTFLNCRKCFIPPSPLWPSSQSPLIISHSIILLVLVFESAGSWTVSWCLGGAKLFLLRESPSRSCCWRAEVLLFSYLKQFVWSLTRLTLLQTHTLLKSLSSIIFSLNVIVHHVSSLYF